jgi:hypothetical protein
VGNRNEQRGTGRGTKWEEEEEEEGGQDDRRKWKKRMRDELSD